VLDVQGRKEKWGKEEQFSLASKRKRGSSAKGRKKPLWPTSNEGEKKTESGKPGFCSDWQDEISNRGAIRQCGQASRGGLGKAW